MESVLLVGGCGFLGLHLIDQFWQVSPRLRIHVLDIRKLPEQIPKAYSFDPKQITVHVADLTSKSQVSRVLEDAKPQVIVHSASPVHGMGSSVYHKVNVVGTRILVSTARENPAVKALVYTSSAGVVFNGRDLYGVDERTPYCKVHMDEYNATKEEGERSALRGNVEGELLTVALRPAGIFGPGDRQMIPNLRNVAKQGRNRIQLGDNNNLFDITYVRNVAYAHVLAAQRLLTASEGVAGEKFFITNDEPVFFWSFARAVWAFEGHTESPYITISKFWALILGYLSQWGCALVGKEPQFTAFRVSTACATRYYDISKAKQVLGYSPKWTLTEALKITLDNLD